MGEVYIRDPMSPGMCGEDVRLFQQGLRLSGYESVPVDGVFGPETGAAWKELFIARRLQDFDFGQAYNNPTLTEQGLGFLREQYPDNEDYQRVLRAYSPSQFSSREAYEGYLRSEPSPVPTDVFAHSWNEMQRSAGDYQHTPGPSPEWGAWMDELIAKLDYTDPFRKTDMPPPGSDACLIADAGKSLAPQEVTDHPLYATLRAKVPTEISDLQVSELTLRALKDGITGPDRLGDVVMTDKRVFAEGTTPGFRGFIDLANPPMTPSELRSAMSELPVAGAAPVEELAQARSVARA